MRPGHLLDFPPSAVAIGRPSQTLRANPSQRQRSRRLQPGPVQLMIRERDARQALLYDREERHAIATADDVVYEQRSQDTDEERQLDGNGYDRLDYFVASDDSVLFTDEDQSTDDDSCTTWEGSDDSREPPGEHETRMRIIQEAYTKTERRSGTGFLVLSCQGAELQSLREEDVHIQRPTSRSPLLEIILDKWLRSNPKPFKSAPLAEFMRQVRQLPTEYAISVYYALVKRIKPVCRSLYRVIHRSIVQYLPDHENALDTANASSKKPNTKAAAAVTPAPVSDRTRKPTSRPPAIRDITDIKDATGRFYSEYRAYARDHKDWPHKAIFECLTPTQASSFSSQCGVSEDTLATMAHGPVMELWRSTFGFRSSAAVLAQLKKVPFHGNILLPTNWSAYHQRFLEVLHQAPLVNQPPPLVVAEVFVENCDNDFLIDDVKAYKPTDHAQALKLVMDRLGSAGFLQSEGLRSVVANRPSRQDSRHDSRDSRTDRRG
jgi:hypothetical protein